MKRPPCTCINARGKRIRPFSECPRHKDQKFCQRGIGKGMPCFASIYTLSGIDEPCEVCAPNIQKMRDLGGWKPFRERYFMRAKLADFQQDALLDRINADAKKKDFQSAGDAG